MPYVTNKGSSKASLNLQELREYHPHELLLKKLLDDIQLVERSIEKNTGKRPPVSTEFITLAVGLRPKHLVTGIRNDRISENQETKKANM